MKIAIVGPESTGKTTTAELLSQWYKGSIVVPEMARVWLAENRKDQYPRPEDYTTFLELQYNAVLEAEEKSHLVISDTEAWTTFLWAKRLHGLCLDITEYLIDFDAYFLMSPTGVPFTPDAQRYGEGERQLSLVDFVGVLAAQDVPLITVRETTLIRRAMEISDVVHALLTMERKYTHTSHRV